MKRLSAAFLAFALCVPATSWAVGLSYGVRAGGGIAFLSDEAAKGGDSKGKTDYVSVSPPFAAGLGVNLDLALLDVEIDALYWHHTYTYDVPVVAEFEATEARLAGETTGSTPFPCVPRWQRALPPSLPTPSETAPAKVRPSGGRIDHGRHTSAMMQIAGPDCEPFNETRRHAARTPCARCKR